jgi:FtsH-binding integral membrane protein
MPQQFDARDIYQSTEYQQELAIQKTFMARVYGWMTLGLLTTALTSLMVASSPAIMKGIFATNLFWVVIVAWFVLGLGFGFIVRRIPAPLAAALFIVYSIITGAALSIVLLVYTASSVGATFLVAAGMFGAMSAWGLMTRRDLTGLGSFMMMGLIGLIIAMVVNLFMQSTMLEWLISFVGVIVFTGLTAYDTQKIKQSYAQGEFGTSAFQKTALFGAFILYLDFINLFLYLLQFMGDRRR